MIFIDDKINVWITSDTHYGHKNIVTGVTSWRKPDGSIPFDETRNFPTIEEMNDMMVNNINQFVKKDDVLIHLGDWSFGGVENIQNLWNRLECKNIHLFIGNHDHYIENSMYSSLFKKLFLSISYYNTLKYRGEIIELMHYPISSWNGLRKGRIHLHGHQHLPFDKKISNGRRMDVGLDGHLEFRPYHLYDECIVPLKKLPIGSESKDDHHLKEKGIVG
jgi:calcineurin-like phosphoesterase family protein